MKRIRLFLWLACKECSGFLAITLLILVCVSVLISVLFALGALVQCIFGIPEHEAFASVVATLVGATLVYVIGCAIFSAVRDLWWMSK